MRLSFESSDFNVTERAFFVVQHVSLDADFARDVLAGQILRVLPPVEANGTK